MWMITYDIFMMHLTMSRLILTSQVDRLTYH